jgi:hypothetical protein
MNRLHLSTEIDLSDASVSQPPILFRHLKGTNWPSLIMLRIRSSLGTASSIFREGALAHS